MRRSRSGLLLRRALWGVGLSLLPLPSPVRAQSSRPASPSTQQPVSVPKEAKAGQFVQVTIEDQGRVTGFVSRYGDGESDKGAFLDLFFKSGKLEGSKLSFATETDTVFYFLFRQTVK